MLSSISFENLGLRSDLPRKPLPLLTWQILSKVPDFVVLAGVFLYGIHWITNRRDEVQRLVDGNASPIAALSFRERLRSFLQRLRRRRELR